MKTKVKTKSYEDLIAEGYVLINEFKVWLTLEKKVGKNVYRVSYNKVYKQPILKVKITNGKVKVCKHI